MYNHAYFQELSREQLKVFFNYMIDHIDIRELENIGDDPKVYLAITIHLKLNGYAPKYSIEYLKNINTGEKQKASHSKNDLLNGGGEVKHPLNTLENFLIKIARMV